MSDKKRRDITLGEMQDECKKYWNKGNLGSCGKCQYMEVCCHYEAYAPAQLNLTDPPRFTEAQMALLKALYGIGINKIRGGAAFDGIYLYMKDLIDTAGLIYSGKIGTSIKLEDGETFDLAELLGKDGESK